MTRLATTAASLVLLALSWICQVNAFMAPQFRIHSSAAGYSLSSSKKENFPYSSHATQDKNLYPHHPHAHSSFSTSHNAIIGTAIATTALPIWESAAVTCLLPTCLGYWKREYGVSYAYGGAVSLTALLAFRSLSSTTSLAACHAAALAFYGIRLNLFLLYRELFVPSMKEMRDGVEKKAPPKRLERTPLILSCAMLYYGLCAPMFVTCQLDKVVMSKTVQVILKGLIGITWGGFLVGAIGDTHKSWVKRSKGKDHLVTGGIYKFLRHPNYTGEFVAWTANALIALVAAVCEDGTVSKPMLGFFALASLFGAAGIGFVLAAATKNLEKKQADKYGSDSKYKAWIKNSWVGFQLKKDEEDHVDPHLELSEEEEERGSGI